MYLYDEHFSEEGTSRVGANASSENAHIGSPRCDLDFAAQNTNRQQ